MRGWVVLFGAQVACGGRVAVDDAGVVVDSVVVDVAVVDSAVVADTFVPEVRVDTAPPADAGPACNPIEPAAGAPCPTIGERCAWNSACGGVDRGICSPAGWSIERGLCPPPTSGCPATRPTKEAACPPSTELCLYGNACGGVIAAKCESTGWSLTEFPCKPACPTAAPVRGSACKIPLEIKTCDYTFGPTCSFSCLCYLEHWTCYGTPCFDPPAGSGLGDAG